MTWFDWAKSLHHTYVGTEHLLLGILEEGGGVAARALRQFKIDFQNARQGVVNDLDPNYSPPEAAASEMNDNMKDELFLQQFESTAWPKSDWHHRQHVKVAYLYLRRHPLELASVKIREGIKTYNAAHHVEESLTSGYHETMTQAWLRLVYFVLCEYGPAETADAFYDQHPELSQVKTLRFFYSRDRFLAPEAKASFVEPDLNPLPHSRKSPPPTLNAG